MTGEDNKLDYNENNDKNNKPNGDSINEEQLDPNIIYYLIHVYLAIENMSSIHRFEEGS